MLAELNQRLKNLAWMRQKTRAAVISETGIRVSTFYRAVKGDTTLDMATAARLLPLVEQVVAPGEPVALTLSIPGVATPVQVIPAPLGHAPLSTAA